MSRPFLRRLAIVFAASAVLSGIGGAQAEEVLRIGFQKSSTLLTLIRSQGTFERELARQGIRVSWHEFPSGLPLLESLNVGNVDLSADVADTVPVFAQAAGARLTYFARETPSPAAQAILVGEHSPLKSLAELKGKRIAVTKAAGSHYLLIAALASAGLEFSDIQPAYLTPADGRAAFENGKVDAWVTWDPTWQAPSASNARGYWPTARAWPATSATTSPPATTPGNILKCSSRSSPNCSAPGAGSRATRPTRPRCWGRCGAISMPLPSSRRMRGAATTYNR